MKTLSSTEPKHATNERFLTLIHTLALFVVCLLANGCATTTAPNLTADQLQILKKTQTVLITANGVEGPQKDFFVGCFNAPLLFNGATPVNQDEKGTAAANYDAVITLKCYCFDYKQYALWGPSDEPNAKIGGKNSATGLGKRIGCRVTIVHKQLGQLFDGDIGGRTPDRISLTPAETKRVLSTPGGYSAYLEERAQHSFKDNLVKSRAWYFVQNMKPKG